jgi:aromatic-L-amino-acid decarboxylase
VAAPVRLSLLCFRHKGENSLNQRLLAEINATGKAFLSHTILKGNFVLRFAIGNFQTTEQDIRETWEVIRETAQKVIRQNARAPARDKALQH